MPTLGSSPSWTNVLGFYGFNPFNKGPTWRHGMTVECGWRHLFWDTLAWMGSWLSWIIIFQHGHWNSPSFSKGPSWKIHEHHLKMVDIHCQYFTKNGVLISWGSTYRTSMAPVRVGYLLGGTHHSLKSTPWELDKRRQCIRMWYLFIFHCWKHVVPENVSIVRVTTVCMLPKTPTDISWEHWVFFGCIESNACSFVESESIWISATTRWDVATVSLVFP